MRIPIFRSSPKRPDPQPTPFYSFRLDFVLHIALLCNADGIVTHIHHEVASAAHLAMLAEAISNPPFFGSFAVSRPFLSCFSACLQPIYASWNTINSSKMHMKALESGLFRSYDSRDRKHSQVKGDGGKFFRNRFLA
ncbi:hypothetical protein [Alicyclobacillus acidiphilus]|uniref:hypothetical protein n=1 Tax=Alicyclobacillus acidiphilus TaxID=182455 RepID=UPI000B0CA6A1|nr:hypothetical protein [Alicyclobacillus acidiphilus]